MAVVTVPNFSLPEIQKAAGSAQDFSVGFTFSTKYDPPHLWMDLGRRNEAMDVRFFDFHRDLDPGAIAHLLDGRIVWRDERQGEWAAVMHFNRPQLAGFPRISYLALQATTTCAALREESRMQIIKATGLHRESGVR
jgi:hypothetical protein